MSLGSVPAAELVTPQPAVADTVHAGITELTEPTMAADSPATVDVIAEPESSTTSRAETQNVLAEPKPPGAHVVDVSSTDVLAMAASVLDNRVVASSRGLPPVAVVGPASSLPPVLVARRVGPASVSRLSALSSLPLPNSGRAGEAFVDVLSLAAPWWSGDSAKHELPDEPWMTKLTVDIAGRPRRDRLDPIGLDVLAVGR